MASFICLYCGQPHAVGIRFCPTTGMRISEELSCPLCGKAIEPGWIVCSGCGQPLEIANAKAVSHSRRNLSLVIGFLIVIGLLLSGYWLLHNLPKDHNTVSPDITEGETESPASLKVNQTDLMTEISSATLTPRSMVTFNSQLPILIGTPVPWPREAISPGNADEVVEQARWGSGFHTDIYFSPDGNEILILSSIGIYFYDSKTLELKDFLDTGALMGDLKYLPGGKILAAGV